MRIEVTTKEMFDNLFESFKDIYWDYPVDSIGVLSITAALAKGEMEVIRGAFAGGHTSLLLGNKMEELEVMPKKEILIRHNLAIIGVLVDCEIDY